MDAGCGPNPSMVISMIDELQLEGTERVVDDAR